MNRGGDVHAYRVHPVPADQNPAVVVYAVVDRVHKTVAFQVPGGTRVVVDVVGARALSMVMSEAVYYSLEPSGPYLRLERDTGDGWTGNVLGMVSGDPK